MSICPTFGDSVSAAGRKQFELSPQRVAWVKGNLSGPFQNLCPVNVLEVSEGFSSGHVCTILSRCFLFFKESAPNQQIKEKVKTDSIKHE